MSHNHPSQILHYLKTHSPTLLNRHLNGDRVAVTPLPQGVWNTNYRVQTQDIDLVFKLYTLNQKSQSLTITNSGDREYEILKLLSAAQLAPRPLVFDKSRETLPHPALVYEYVQGDPIVYTDESILAMAHLYSRLHSLPYERAHFLKTRPETLPDLAGTMRQRFAAYANRDDVSSEWRETFRRFLERAETQIVAQDVPPHPLAILHTDPLAGNIIVNGHPKLIDWQSPALGDPAYDVWAFTADPFTLWDREQGPSAAQTRLFRETYSRLRRDETLDARIAAKEAWYLLEYGLHCATRYQDFLSGNFPARFLQERKSGFDKYRPTVERIFARLAALLG